MLTRDLFTAANLVYHLVFLIVVDSEQRNLQFCIKMSDNV